VSVWDGNMAALQEPTPAEREDLIGYARRQLADYCGEHGYPSGDLVGADTAPGSQYPPHPTDSDGGVWVGWSWARVRRELLGEHEPQQMEMVLA
jgi:hypothetical protein